MKYRKTITTLCAVFTLSCFVPTLGYAIPPETPSTTPATNAGNANRTTTVAPTASANVRRDTNGTTTTTVGAGAEVIRTDANGRQTSRTTVRVEGSSTSNRGGGTSRGVGVRFKSRCNIM